MIASPSYRLVPKEFVIRLVSGFEAINSRLAALQSRHRELRKFEKRMRRNREDSAALAGINAAMEFGKGFVAEWIAGGCARIPTSGGLLESADEIPFRVLKLWACHREAAKQGEQTSFLAAIPADIAAFLCEIETSINQN